MKHNYFENIEEVSEEEFLSKQLAYEQMKDDWDLISPHFYLEIGNERLLLTTDLTRAYEKIKAVVVGTELDQTFWWFVFGYEYTKKVQEITK